MRRFLAICAAVGLAGVLCLAASAQDFRAPDSVVAGDEASVSTSGSGRATFYLVGPGVSRKSEVNLGEEIHLAASELRNAGGYVAIVCSDSCRSAIFYVSAAKPASLAFLVHPSRVPVSQGDAVSGVAVPFDRFHNLVQAPVTINFQLMAGNASVASRSARTQDGVAWFRTASGRSAGSLQVTATVDRLSGDHLSGGDLSGGDLSARRAVQQVASDPCNLRIKGQRTPGGILVQTEPVHDCAGNVVPDGTIVTFTAAQAHGRSTVDAPIKQGIARAQMAAWGPTVVSVASGVVMGNELRIEGQP
jgi:hypothetical protein